MYKKLRTFPLDEPETRDAWWNELRIEIRSHMKAMACTAVIGYTETTAIWQSKNKSKVLLGKLEKKYMLFTVKCCM